MFIKIFCSDKINKAVTMHYLGHNFATHLLGDSTDRRYVQELLGQNKPKITMHYTYIVYNGLK